MVMIMFGFSRMNNVGYSQDPTRDNAIIQAAIVIAIH
jgi:hypothetical protein